ncbi:ABC transporter permease [candidate division KSB1 bacterium]|nr:ABC transporter permease [candidate division KSB1 bacterium]
MGGKLLGYFVIGLIQFTVIFTFGYVMGLRFGSDPLALIVTLVAFTLAATGLALMLTTFVKTEMQASSITTLLSLTLAPLGGAWWPLDIVPAWMHIAGHISPIAWAMDAYNALIFRDAGLDGVVLPVLVLLGMATLFLWSGCRASDLITLILRKKRQFVF